jgi:hypothetical protein
VKNGMVLGEDVLQLVWEVFCFFGVALGDVGDQVDEVVEGLDEAGARVRRCEKEQLSLRLVLFPLSEEVIFVGSAPLVFHRSLLGEVVQTYLGSRRIFCCRFALKHISQHLIRSDYNE